MSEREHLPACPCRRRKAASYSNRVYFDPLLSPTSLTPDNHHHHHDNWSLQTHLQCQRRRTVGARKPIPSPQRGRPSFIWDLHGTRLREEQHKNKTSTTTTAGPLSARLAPTYFLRLRACLSASFACCRGSPRLDLRQRQPPPTVTHTHRNVKRCAFSAGSEQQPGIGEAPGTWCLFLLTRGGVFFLWCLQCTAFSDRSNPAAHRPTSPSPPPPLAPQT